MTDRDPFLWQAIEAAVFMLRADAGDAHETVHDVFDWQESFKERFCGILDRVGHPTDDKLWAARQTTITLMGPRL